MPKQSVVVKFMNLVWSHAGGHNHSWEQYNQDVREAAHLAARSFAWVKGDLKAMLSLSNSRYSIYKCLGENAVDLLYRTAVTFDNVSAYQEIERELGREPIIADDVVYTKRNARRGESNFRERGRICLWCSFTYGKHRVEVTSFRKDGKAVCCYYEGESRKPKKRYTIGPEDIYEDRKTRKAIALAHKAAG